MEREGALSAPVRGDRGGCRPFREGPLRAPAVGSGRDWQIKEETL